MKLNADLTQRAAANINELKWELSPSIGVDRLRLERDDDNPPVERVTTVVRFAPNSSFSGHVHGGGEEFFVLEGVFSDQYADYPAGYYVRNPKGTGHAPHSDEGCTILVKLWQMDPDDQQQIAINTRDQTLWQNLDDGVKLLNLFSADYETVDMIHWPGHYQINEDNPAGAEYFLLQGELNIENENYSQGSWLRFPAGDAHSIQAVSDSLILRKTSHLLNPVAYEA